MRKFNSVELGAVNKIKSLQNEIVMFENGDYGATFEWSDNAAGFEFKDIELSEEVVAKKIADWQDVISIYADLYDLHECI